MQITIFKKANDGNHSLAKTGETTDVSFETLHSIIQTQAWSAATFTNNSRNKENFLGVDCIALDFDGGISVNDVLNRLRTLGFSHSVTASKSHQIEKNGEVCDRFRLVIPLSKRIDDAKEYASTWQFLNSLFPECDQACKNEDRYYSPSPKSLNFKADGSCVNPVPPPKNVPKTTSKETKTTSSYGILHRDALYFLENAASLNGKFNDALNKAAFMLARGGISQETARTMLESVSPSPFDSNDIKTFNSGYESGEKKGLMREAKKAATTTDEEIVDICTDYFTNVFHVVEDDQGRRNNLLQELPGKIVKRTSTDKISGDIGRLIADVMGTFLEAVECRRHADNWIMYTTALTETPRTVAFENYTGLAFHKLDFIPAEGPAPLFEEFLSRTTNAHALQAFIWSLFVDESDRQQYVWMYGDGGNGKSSIGDFLGRCLGPSYMAKNSVNMYNNKNFTSTLVNKRLAVFEDSNSTKFVQSGTFKEITGGGAIEVEFKYEGAYSTHINTKFIFFSNFQPELSSKLADLRRIILCHVGPITGEPDSHYTDKLWEERAAILFKCKMAYEEIASGKGVIACEKLDTSGIAIDGEMAYESVFNEYLSEGGEIGGLELYDLLRGGLRNHNLKMNQFKDWLIRQKGVKVVTDTRKTVYVGIQK